MMRPMSSQAPEAVLFDNDGLLLDTESVWTRAEQDMFDAYGYEFTAEHKHDLIGKSGAMAAQLLEGWLDQEGRGVELMAELDRMVVIELDRGVEAMVGARDLLERLKAQGTPIGLVSNSPLHFVERSLAIVGFEAIFDTIVSGHEVERPKPDPDPYLEACRRLDVEPGPSVIALEDSPTGVAAARAAGLTVIGVPSVDGIELVEAHHIAASLLDATVLGLTVV
jgi:HAD superfamily hydrolase (TIGR01509 family)